MLTLLPMRRFSILLITLLATVASPLSADLVWTPDAGWQARGGVLEPFLGTPEGQTGVELMNEARALQEKGNNWKALSLYKEVINKYSTSILAPEAHYQRGRIYEERHQFKRSFDEYLEILRRYPDYPKFNQVIIGMYDLADRIRVGARPYFWGVIPWFRDYGQAVDVYEGVVQNAPFSEYAPLSLMHIAEVANREKRPEDAIDALDRLINDYPQSTLTPDAYLGLAQTYSDMVQGANYDQGATREAIRYYQDYLILYPGSNGAYLAEAGLYYMRETLAQSKYNLGEFYYRYRNNNRAALVFYNEAITLDPNSPSAERARKAIKKIEEGVPAPRTPVDWIFGRYHNPNLKNYEEQSEVDAMEDDAFQIQQTEAFLETPGAMAEEEFVDGTEQTFEGVGMPLTDPVTGAVFEEGVLTPVEQPGPDTTEQRATDRLQRDNAANPDLPAGN